MRSNPIPHESVAIEAANHAITSAHAGRVGWWVGAYSFEPQAGMIMILDEQPMGVPRLLLHMSWQQRESLAEQARYSRWHGSSFRERQRTSRPMLSQSLFRQTRQLVPSLLQMTIKLVFRRDFR